MYQLQTHCSNEHAFRQFIQGVREKVGDVPDERVMFHLFNDSAESKITDHASTLIRKLFPGSCFVGCSASGNICDGEYAHSDEYNLTIICNVFEHPDTRIEVHQYPLDYASSQATSQAILQIVSEKPWVKAVEMITTIIDVAMADFCVEISGVRDDIVVFGGAALTPETIDMYKGLPYIFSNDGENSGHGIAFVLYGGEELHATTQTVVGWKQLGRALEITRAQGPVIYELDGIPAFDCYQHYLSMEDDDMFSQNSLIFPVAIEHEGRSVIKAPVKVGEDKSLTLSSDLADYHKKCRLAYGDPATILRSIKESAHALQDFEPEGVLAFSCAARLMYWGPEFISRETDPFQQIAPTAGFYTGSEFARDKGKVLHHNVTLVIAGFREGPCKGGERVEVQINETEFSRQMSIVNSLAAFVGVTSAELEAAYERMTIMAKTDGLTGVWNRREIESRIDQALEDFDGQVEGAPPAALSVSMIDIDDFKAVNDTYSHKAGDVVLRGLGDLLHRMIDEAGIGSSGRWGGEEFMVLLPGMSADDAVQIAQRLCDEFASIEFELSGKHTMSLGVAQATAGETTDLLTQRADKALYEAKGQGKNRVVVA